MSEIFNSIPLVSVIMPAYRAERYIEEAIRSVQAQTVTDWELLVLIDGPEDSSIPVAQALAREDSRIRVSINPANVGAAATRNRGLELCRGEYVAFLDSDDLWHPEKLQTQLARMDRAELCYTSYAIIDEAGVSARPDYLVSPSLDFDGLLKENIIGCSTVLLRGEIARKYRFTTDFYHEDYVLWLQLLRDGCRAVGCTEVLTRWRLAENSRSFDKGNAAKNRWRIYRQYLHLPMPRAIRAFCAYALAGLRKYRK